MNRNLREVRRYWPKAEPNGQLCVDGVMVVSWYRSHRGKCASIRIGPVGCRVVAQGSPALTYDAATISAAMRAAGFGLRPLGPYALLARKWLRYRASGVLPAGTHGTRKFTPTRLADRQRPRNGARLGEKKRREVANA